MKCMDAALAPLRFQCIRVLNYLDDWLILAHSRELVSHHRDIVLRHIHSLGLRMNAKKSVLFPSQRTVFFRGSLGFRSDAGQFGSCPDIKFYSMSGLLQARPSCLSKYLPQAARPHGSGLSCVAPRVASHEAVPLVGERAEITPHDTSHSPNQGVVQLLSTLFTMAGPRFSPEWGQNGCDSPSPYDHDGRINDGLGRSLRRQTGAQGMDRRVPSWHINCLELRSVFLALMHFLPVLGEHHIIVRTDNMVVVSHISRQGGSRSRTLDRLAHRLLLWSQDKFLSLRAVHVPGMLNLAADFLSRQKLWPGERMLNRQTLSQIWNLFGEAEVDLFASQESSQCLLWFSLSFPMTLDKSPPVSAPLGDSDQAGPAVPASGQDLASSTRALEVVGMAHTGPRALMNNLPVKVQETIASARAPATRNLYSSKWGVFESWCLARAIGGSCNCPVGPVLDFLQERLTSGAAQLTHSLSYLLPPNGDLV